MTAPDKPRVTALPKIISRRVMVSALEGVLHYETDTCHRHLPCLPADPTDPKVLEWLEKQGEK